MVEPEARRVPADGQCAIPVTECPSSALALDQSMSNRTPRQAARQDRILTVARELITTLGYDGLNMRELANAANVSPTTLYNLYVDKDALVLAATSDLLHDIRANVDKRAPEPGCERILVAIDMQARQIERTPEMAAAMTRALFQAPPDHPFIRSMLWATHKQTLASLKTMYQLAQLRPDVDIPLLTRVLTAAPFGSMLLWAKDLLPVTELRRTLRDTALAILIAHTQDGLRCLLQERLTCATAIAGSRIPG
jgi:AcrR family transcriptional regulator